MYAIQENLPIHDDFIAEDCKLYTQKIVQSMKIIVFSWCFISFFFSLFPVCVCVL